jgi:ABC-type Mn2+/Zn2+ transport system permease subunit
VASALVAVAVGFSLSVPFDLPSAPAMIAVSGVLALLAWVVRRTRE